MLNLQGWEMNHVDGAESGQSSEIQIAACLFQLCYIFQASAIVVHPQILALVGMKHHRGIGG